MFNTTVNGRASAAPRKIYPDIGWAAGGMVGYDFVGPRVELEGVYRQQHGDRGGAPVGSRVQRGRNINQVAIMANLLYDFNAAARSFLISAPAPVSPSSKLRLAQQSNSTQFAYQAIIGVGYNIDLNLRFNLEGRYFGTTSPYLGRRQRTYNNNNISRDAGPAVQVRRTGCRRRRRRRRRCRSRRRSWCSSIGTARTCRRRRWPRSSRRPTPSRPRVTPASRRPATPTRRARRAYNMALSLRRANTVKDALVRDGVPAHGDLRHRQGRDAAAGADRRRRARAAEPPRRDRHPVRRSEVQALKGGRGNSRPFLLGFWSLDQRWTKGLNTRSSIHIFKCIVLVICMEMQVLPARHRLFAILPGLLNATSHGVISFQLGDDDPPTSTLGIHK